MSRPIEWQTHAFSVRSPPIEAVFRLTRTRCPTGVTGAMPTDEEIAAAKAAEDAAAKEAADKEAAEAKELGLGDSGKAALKAERDARKAADKAAADAAKELAELRKEKAERDAAKAAADEEAAAKRGEFESLATKRKEEADAAKAEAKAHADKLARAETVLKSVIATRVKELESTEDKDLIAAFPNDADPLEQLEWLDDPRTKSALKVALEEKKVETAQGKPKVPKTPNANGTGKESDEDARATQARAYRDW